MEKSEVFGFNLPSSSVDDIADISLISDNFKVIEDKVYPKNKVEEKLGEKQETLKSGENIKTLEGNSILGEGDINLTENLANAVKKTLHTNQLFSKGVVIDDISPVKHTIKLEFSMFDGDISQYHILRYGENENDNPQTYAINEDKTVDGITSLYPVTTLKLIGETSNIFIAYIEYNQDTNKALENIGGSSVIVDQTYNPESKNAQSGKAVAEAIGDIETALDELHNYAQALINGGAE
jgi:hypothetical protein